MSLYGDMTMNDEIRLKGALNPQQQDDLRACLAATLEKPCFAVERGLLPAPPPQPALSAGATAIREKLPVEEREIFDQRYEVYGDPVVSHTNIGRAWAATLSQYYGTQLKDIPADVVALLLVQFKALRSTKAFHQDNYDDLRTYATIAEGARKGRNE